jgi:very-short-patch-repair endonuclease
MRSRYRRGLLEGVTRQRARDMRTDQASAEKLLWSKLRRRNIGSAKFRRQHPLYGFVVDFCCLEHRLVIEVDGDSHAERAGYDAWRAEQLGEHGFRVIRFFNDEIRNNLSGVIETIWQAVRTPPPSPSPVSNNGGRGRKLTSRQAVSFATETRARLVLRKPARSAAPNEHPCR